MAFDTNGVGVAFLNSPEKKVPITEFPREIIRDPGEIAVMVKASRRKKVSPTATGISENMFWGLLKKATPHISYSDLVFH